MTTETTPPTETASAKAKQSPIYLMWIGAVTTIGGALSYFMYFYQFENLRDFPILNLPLVLLGVVIVIIGSWKVFTQPDRWLGKIVTVPVLLISLGMAGLFNFYIFSLSYELPAATGAPATETRAPDFTLSDHQGQDVSLADFRGKKLVLVFYRGNW